MEYHDRSSAMGISASVWHFPYTEQFGTVYTLLVLV